MPRRCCLWLAAMCGFTGCLADDVPISMLCDLYNVAEETCYVISPKILSSSNSSNSNLTQGHARAGDSRWRIDPLASSIYNVSLNGSLIFDSDGSLTCDQAELCQIVLTINDTLALNPNTFIVANTVDIVAMKISISSGSTVNADGLGWLYGPACPAVPGAGGSHAGSGGLMPCMDDAVPVGTGKGISYSTCCDGISPYISFNTSYDDYWGAANRWDVGYGSGGGFPGAGRGGGRISLNAFQLLIDGYVSADGGAGNMSDLGDGGGAGAGGTVLIAGESLSGLGSIRADGGQGSAMGMWAAGGGGRVIIRVQDLSMPATNIQARGGNYDQNPVVAPSTCILAAAGTVFLSEIFQDANSSVSVNQLRIANGNVQSLAFTPLSLSSTDNEEDMSAVDSLFVSSMGNIATSSLVLRAPPHLPFEFVGPSFFLGISFSSSAQLRPLSAVSSPGDSVILHSSEIDMVDATITMGAVTLLLEGGNVTLGTGVALLFSGAVHIRANHSAYIHNAIEALTDQVKFGDALPSLVVLAEAKLIVESSAGIRASNIWLYSGGELLISGTVATMLSPSWLQAACNLPQMFSTTCNTLPPRDESMFMSPILNFSLILSADVKLSVDLNGEVFAHSGLLCGTFIHLQSAVTSAGLGCPSGYGVGPGFKGIESGGGAGHASLGGASAPADVGKGGSQYDSPLMPLLPGSGGGSGLDDSGGAGGGYLSLEAREVNIEATASINADGSSSRRAGGGGSGGSIVVRTLHLVGSGSLTAEGGDGALGGGGASGGLVLLKPSILTCYDEEMVNWYAFLHAPLDADTMCDGVQTAEADCIRCQVSDCDPSWRAMCSFSTWLSSCCVGNSSACGIVADIVSSLTPVGPILIGHLADGFLGGEIAQEYFGQIFVEGGAGAAGGAAGGNGSISAPVCPGGYGGVPRCAPCGVGRYRVFNKSTATDCSICTNAPVRAEYTDATSGTAACAYICPAGYLYPNCDTPFEQVLGVFGGTVGFICSVAGVILVLLLVLLCLCRFRQLRIASMTRPARSVDEKSKLLASGAVDGDWDAGRNLLDVDFVVRELQQPRLSVPVDDLIAAAALRERDAHHHVARIYLMGFNTFGRPWFLPESVPASARAYVRTKHFRRFAADLNSKLAWPRCGWEALVFVLLSTLFYPAAAAFDGWRRRQRVLKLFQVAFANDSAPWVKTRTKHALVSEVLRVGVSADLTLAYVDVLTPHTRRNANAYSPVFSATATATRCYSNRVPLVIPFAGEGTFVAPYHLDANDPLVRGVPSIPGLSRFIDNDWVEFVVETNLRARCLTAGAEGLTMGALVTFLDAVSSSKDALGGLKVQLLRCWPGAHGVVNSVRSASEAIEPTSMGLIDSFCVSLDDMRFALLVTLDNPAGSATAADALSHQLAPVTASIPIPQAKPIPSTSTRSAIYGDAHTHYGMSYPSHASYPEVEYGSLQLALDDDGVALVQDIVATSNEAIQHPDTLDDDEGFLPVPAPAVMQTTHVIPGSAARRASRSSIYNNGSSRTVSGKPQVVGLGPPVVGRHKTYHNAVSTCGWLSSVANFVFDEALHGFVDIGGSDDCVGAHLDMHLPIPGLLVFPQPAAETLGPARSALVSRSMHDVDDSLSDFMRRLAVEDALAGGDSASTTVGASRLGTTSTESDSFRPRRSTSGADSGDLEIAQWSPANAAAYISPAHATTSVRSGRRFGVRPALFCLERALRRRRMPLQPSRPRVLWLVAAGHIFLLLTELAMTLMLSAQVFCIEPETEAGGRSEDGVMTTASSSLQLVLAEGCDYTPFIVYLSAPPGATFVPPLLGLAALALQSASTMNIYAAWNGRSLWTASVAFAVTLIYLKVLGRSVIAIPIALFAAKIISAQLVPLELAEFEADRPVRGWRGLYEVRRGPFERTQRKYSAFTAVGRHGEAAARTHARQ